MISYDITAAVRYASHILHIGDKTFFGIRDEYLGSELGSVFVNLNSETGIGGMKNA